MNSPDEHGALISRCRVGERLADYWGRCGEIDALEFTRGEDDQVVLGVRIDDYRRRNEALAAAASPRRQAGANQAVA